LTYMLVAVSYIASPGPAVFLTMNNSIKYGFNRAIFTVIGNSLGLAFLALLFSLGISEIFARYPMIIGLIKIIGALYIAYLSLKTIGIIKVVNKGKRTTINSNSDKTLYLIKEGFLLAATNPKPILFFGAVFPQFILKDNSFRDQFLVLSIIFIILSASILIIYALITKFAKEKFSNDKFKSKINICFGSLLFIMSLMLAYSAINDL
ncbi:LysE family translocator, partial [Acinetobacter nectaris]|uniref:LysE family translocator n=1 Tax=Acinetobacter nectaris TaxID=1219382 RepID=UPI001F2A1991